MTITYIAEVSKSDIFAFARTLLRWKGSVWKAVIFECILWSLCYTVISLIYRLALNDFFKLIIYFGVCLLCYQYIDFIPITFMMGFFVSVVVTRWWSMFSRIGWIDNFALLVVSYIRGTDEKARRIRRSIIRYVCFCQVLIFRSISVRVRKRFPSMESLELAGTLLRIILTVKSFNDIKFWMPIRWAMHIIRDARSTFDDHLNLWFTDWVPVPLVYTQVIFVSVRLYFIVALLGRQFLNSGPQRQIDIYVPFVTIIQLICYTGWSKVAEALLNPFGEDDDDFECNWIIDRNLQIGLAIVDDKPEVIPPLLTDKFWNEANAQLLYSVQTATQPQNPNIGSAALLM
uniref:Bestrophin homolog n=1 Tax=Syphacia muris TaxID=451379 RepID=A0A0N5APH8_9BILA